MSTVPDTKYETRSVKSVRGFEARTKAKLEREGWEFVSQTPGRLHSELNFRRQRAVVSWKKLGLGAAALALLVIGSIIMGVVGGDKRPEAATTALPSAPSTQSASAGVVPPTPTPTQTKPPATDISVDDLLDRLNAGKSGGVKVGDRFRLTGELFMSKLWMTGATGEYNVMLKAQGGSQDLSVFIDKSLAAGWRDGMRVTMLVEMGEATIRGETTDGWLRALSADVNS